MAGHAVMATGRGAWAIDSLPHYVRRDRLGKMAGKAAEQRRGAVPHFLPVTGERH